MTRVMPTVDILLATYNGHAYLPEQLRSIEAQDYGSWRLIARDDGSSDSTLALLKAFRERHQERVTLAHDEDGNLGPCGNFARLLALSDAPYFTPCDQDDVWLSGKLSRMVAAIKKAEGKTGEGIPILLHSDLMVVDRELRRRSDSLWRHQFINPRRSRWSQLVVQNVVTGCASIGNSALRRAALPVPNEAVMHDWWFALVAAVVGRIEWISDRTVLYRQHGANDTGAKPWNLSYILRSLPALLRDERLQESLNRYRRQARALLASHGASMSARDRSGLDAFSRIMSFPGFRRRVILFRFGIWKTGLLRNAALLARI